MAKLEVEIGAEIKDLQTKVNQASKTLDKFSSKADKSLNNLGKSSTTATKSLDNLKKGAISGNSAMTAFSRTVQDAPFGIMGVSNNITNLTEQFGYLKNKTGSASGALKAMGKDLMGFGGITFLISAITSLALVYSDEIGEMIKSNNALLNSQKEVNKALNDFYGGQVTKINSYMSILDDVNTSEEQRKNITKELIKLVPSLKKEDFNYGSNLDVVRSKIGSYVLAQASRVEADTLVQENSKKLSQQARVLQIKDIKDETQRLTAFRKFLKDSGERLNKEVKTSSYKVGGGKITIAKSDEDILNDFNNFTDKLEKDLKPVQERINQLYSTTFNGGLSESSSGGGKPLKGKKDVKPFFERTYADYKTGIDGFQDLILNNQIDFGLMFKDFDPSAIILPKLTELQEKSMAIIDGGLKNAFSGIGQVIGESMVNGGNVIAGLGSVLLGALGGVLQQLGVMAITTGTALEVIKTALLNPLTGGLGAIGAGIALIAVGSAFSAGASSLASSGSGSNASAGGGSDTGINSFGGGFSGGYSQNNRVEFVLRGQDLYGSLDNYLRRNGNQGGTIVIG